jgi:hypothetical protein
MSKTVKPTRRLGSGIDLRQLWMVLPRQLPGVVSRKWGDGHMGRFDASTPDLEAWLLAAALTAHPAHDLPLEDLLRLPELFPFRFTVNADLLRRSGWFEVYRQGSGWDMVALAETGYHTRDKIVDLVRQTKRDLADERIPAG